MFDLFDASSFEVFIHSAADGEIRAAEPDTCLPIDLVVSAEATEALTGLYRSTRTFPCSGRAEIFFAPPGERRTRREKREMIARAYCNQCAVKEMCKLAGRTGREHGIWGGETEEERAAAGFQPRFPPRKAIRAAGRHREEQALSA